MNVEMYNKRVLGKGMISGLGMGIQHWNFVLSAMQSTLLPTNEFAKSDFSLQWKPVSQRILAKTVALTFIFILLLSKNKTINSRHKCNLQKKDGLDFRWILSGNLQIYLCLASIEPSRVQARPLQIEFPGTTFGNC
jgi:hypothetical protein